MQRNLESLPRAARWIAFVGVNVLAVALYLEWLRSWLPPLMDEGRDLVLVPVTCIASITFLLMHPVLMWIESHLGRLSLLAAAFGGGIAAFTATFFVSLGPQRADLPSPLGLLVFAVLMQVLYGAPMFLGLAGLNKVLSPILIGVPARRWA